MAFAWDGRRFASVAEFEAYLNSFPPQPWCDGVTVHHTWSPTLPEWHAAGWKARMDGLARYYEHDVVNRDGSKGWSAGPHLFISDKEICLGTPMNQRGVHGLSCNTDRYGFEVVGDYDKVYWSPETEYNVLGCIAAVLRKEKVGVERVNGHRDCGSSKSCPGNAISMDVVRRKVGVYLGTRPAPVPVAAEDRQVIGVEPSISLRQFQTYLLQQGVDATELPAPEVERIYTMCDWLDIDPAFLAAVWKQESFGDFNADGKWEIGDTELQRQSRSPINIRAANDEWRPTVNHAGGKWLGFQTWQLGLMQSLVHLKNVHGAAGRLTVRTIIPVHAPSWDKNHPETFIKNVLSRMDQMKAL